MLKAEHIGLHRAGVRRERGEVFAQPAHRIIVFFHGGHVRTRHAARDGRRDGPAARAQVEHDGLTRRGSGEAGGFERRDLRVGARDEHALADAQREVEKIPLAEDVLERAASRPVGAHGAEGFLLFLRELEIGQCARVASGHRAAQALRVERGVLHARFAQLRARGAVRVAQRHHAASSRFSGRTGRIAATAHSIIESSGSFVVMCCSHSPGAETACVTGLSYRPQNLMIS